MWTNPQETLDLFTFAKEILNEKLKFFVQWRVSALGVSYMTFNFPALIW